MENIIIGAVVVVVTLAFASSAQNSRAERFQVFWNIPLQRCNKEGVHIDPQIYGFTVNEDEEFFGDKIALLYNPGKFPQYIGDGTALNGGIPQLGNLTQHLQALSLRIHNDIPNANFSGVAVFDFEIYQPFFERAPPIYKQKSLELARQQHPTYNWHELLPVATESFNKAARKFLEQSLLLARNMRPRARWGFYQYPLCGNLGVASGDCSQEYQQENNRLDWLYNVSSGIYPSLYVYAHNYDDQSRHRFVSGHVREITRLSLTHRSYPYVMAQYHDKDGHFVSKADLYSMLGLPYLAGTPGVIFWGKSASVNSTQSCLQMKHYLSEYLGPIVANLTGSI